MFRTVKGGDALLQGWDIAWVGLATFVIPPLLGLLTALAIRDLNLVAEPLQPIAFVIYVLIAQTAAPIVTWFALPPALLLGRLALRHGWGGWALAIAVPTGLIAAFMAIYAQTDTGYAPIEYLDTTVIFAGSGAVHGLVMWLFLRWLRPAVVAPRGTQNAGSF
jgi:hypothetical protein